MSRHVTHDAARAALADPDVPIDEAVELFRKAYRRSNDATKGFVYWMHLDLREHRKQKRGQEQSQGRSALMKPEEIVARAINAANAEPDLGYGMRWSSAYYARAALQALRDAGWRVVPEIATQEMLAAAVMEPTHLYPTRTEEYQRQMKIAVEIDRLSALTTWRRMLAAATGAGESVTSGSEPR